MYLPADYLTVLICLAIQAGQMGLLQFLTADEQGGPQMIVYEDAIYEVSVRRLDAAG